MFDAVKAAPEAAVFGWAFAATLGLVALGVALLRVMRRARSLEQLVFTERMDRQHFETLAPSADSWLWQTDSSHRIVRLQAPTPAQGLRTLKSAEQARQWIGQPVDELLRCTDDATTLGQLLERRADWPSIACAWATPPQDKRGSAPAKPLIVRALAQHDSQGQFRGYLGVLHAKRSDTGTEIHEAAVSTARVHDNARATVAHDAAPRTAVGAASGAVNAAAEASTLTRAGQGPVGVHAGRGAQPAAEALAAEQASFTYTVTHDLRAPIRVVEGFTRIIKEDYAHSLDRVGLDHLDRVLGAAARMNAMIDALLALSRLSQQPLSRQPVNLSRLAEYIMDDLRRSSPERSVQTLIEPDIVVDGDPTLLRIVLENLLGNAWKYSAKMREAQISFQTDPSVPGVAYVVRDNGAGFDMRFADRLFGVFQRLHSASDFQGTGVGLASVQRIVRRHGGDIWAESAVGRGSTFRFTLSPMTLGEAMSHDPAAASDSVWMRSELPAMPELQVTPSSRPAGTRRDSLEVEA